MKTSDFYAVAPLTPVNRTAGNVASRGDHFEFRDKPTKKVMHAPPLPVPIPRNPQFVDLTGKKVGRLTVVSYAGEHKGSTRWNVRCVCGLYEQRRRKALNSPEYAKTAACSECDAVAQNRLLYRPENRAALDAKRQRRCA